MHAGIGASVYGISENAYLNRAASSRSHEVTITVGDDGMWSYDEVTILQMIEFADPFRHTDRAAARRLNRPGGRGPTRGTRSPTPIGGAGSFGP